MCSHHQLYHIPTNDLWPLIYINEKSRLRCTDEPPAKPIRTTESLIHRPIVPLERHPLVTPMFFWNDAMLSRIMGSMYWAKKTL
jgi:hypothetical protein